MHGCMGTARGGGGGGGGGGGWKLLPWYHLLLPTLAMLVCLNIVANILYHLKENINVRYSHEGISHHFIAFLARGFRELASYISNPGLVICLSSSSMISDSYSGVFACSN